MRIKTRGYMRSIVEETISRIRKSYRSFLREGLYGESPSIGASDNAGNQGGGVKAAYQKIFLYVRQFVQSFVAKVSRELQSIPITLPSGPRGIRTFGDLFQHLASEYHIVTQAIAAAATEKGVRDSERAAQVSPSGGNPLTPKEEIDLESAIGEGAEKAQITLEDAEYLISLARDYTGAEGHGARTLFFALSLPIVLAFFWRKFYPKTGRSLVRKWGWEMRTLNWDADENRVQRATTLALEQAASIIDILGAFLNLVRSEIFFQRESSIYQVTPDLVLKAQTPGRLLWFISLRAGNPGNNFRGRIMKVMNILTAAYQKPNVINKTKRASRNPTLAGAVPRYPALFPPSKEMEQGEIYAFDTPEEATAFANRHAPLTSFVGRNSVLYRPPEESITTIGPGGFDDEEEELIGIAPRAHATDQPEVSVGNAALLAEVVRILKSIRGQAARKPTTVEAFFKLFLCDAFLYSLQPAASESQVFARRVKAALDAHPDVLALLRQVNPGSEDPEVVGATSSSVKATIADVEKFLGIAPGDERGKGGSSDSAGGVLGIEDIALIVVSTYQGVADPKDVETVLQQITAGMANYSRLENTLKVARKRAKRDVKDANWAASPRNGIYVQIVALAREQLGIDLSTTGNPITELIRQGTLTERVRKKSRWVRIPGKR